MEAARPGVLLNRTDETSRQQPARQGFARRLLKLLVEADSSRHASSRLVSLLVLLAILCAFALAGYGLAAWLFHG